MKSIFCNNLVFFRKEKGYTQHNMAQMLGVVDSCYANWEQGRTEPDITNIIKLCEIFEIEADYLLGIKKIDNTKNIFQFNIKQNNNINIKE